MSTEIAVRDSAPASVRLSNDQLDYIARTEFVPPGLRGNLPAILACVATGRELGIGDMVALKSIHIIDGKATFSAELMVQLVRRRGHSITGEVSEGSATVVGTRADNGDTMTSTWTLAMAERAGLLGKQNWRKYPEAMLWARAASQLCRMLFADCFAGATYTPEELEDGVGTAATGSEREPQAEPGSLDGTAVSAEQVQHAVQPSRSEKLITAAQKKKADVVVAELRDAGRLTTEQVYAAAGHPVPELADGETLHWGSLRDTLTKAEASVLIDRLETYAASDATVPPLEEWAAEAGEVEPAGLASDVQRRMLVDAAARYGLDGSRARRVLVEVAGVASLAELPASKVDDVFKALRAAGRVEA